MKSYNIAKLVSKLQSFVCQMCGKNYYNKMYEYQAYSYVSTYKPEHLKKVCVNCIYKEIYGNKWKVYKKEGTLDE